MDSVGAEILRCLQRVAEQRILREANPVLASRTLALKSFQQERFRRSYSDLLAHPRYKGAAQFFLEELYGPADFSKRDAQFRRIVKPLVHLFPQEIVATVLHLAELHALSEELDSEMAQRLSEMGVIAAINSGQYLAAWQQVAGRAEREMQIALTLKVGRALDIYTRKPILRHALRLMRAPASAAGLHELQAFLECGFETFRSMGGAEVFLDTVAMREEVLAGDLFSGDPYGRLSAIMA